MSTSIRLVVTAFAVVIAGSALAATQTNPPPAAPSPTPGPAASPATLPPAKSPVPATPVTTWFAQLDVPAEAIARGQTGVVSVKIDIDNQGRVTGCAPVETSGWALLDATACAAIKARATFQPAQDAAGKPVATSIIVPRIRYTIKEGQSLIAVASGKRTIFNRTIRVGIDKAGLVTSCMSLNTDMPQAMACADYPVGKPAPTGVAGKAGVARTVVLSLTAVADYEDAPAAGAKSAPAK
jgi:TonB family protein